MAKETYRNVRKNRFTQVGNEMLWNSKLTLQAKGLLTIFLSNSEDWDLNMKEIIRRSKNGRDAHYKVVNELIDHGYFARVEVRNDKNHFEEMIYIFSDDTQDVLEELEQFKDKKNVYVNLDKKGNKTENKKDNTPLPENQETAKKPFTENQETGKKDAENQKKENQYNNNNNQNNTNLNNTKNNNTNINQSSSNTIDTALNEIEDLPISVKKQISLNKDRLIDDNIDPYEINAFYKSSDNTVNDNDFAMIISNVLKKTKGKISSFHAVMKTAIKNWKDEYNDNLMPNVMDEEMSNEPIDLSTLPEYLQHDWLND